MAGATDRRVALFSIHPHYADAILRGDKRVEFRRRGPSSATSHVIVYATAPVQRIVGWFRVEAVEEETPSTLWERFGVVGGIELEEFDRYYGRRSRGTAICVADPSRLVRPLAMDAIAGSSRPPQSYRYVPWEVFQAVAAGTTAGSEGATPNWT